MNVAIMATRGLALRKQRKHMNTHCRVVYTVVIEASQQYSIRVVVVALRDPDHVQMAIFGRI